MVRKTTYATTVEFGDCDPAGIAFYPNFFRWYDASLRHFFVECGLPPWRELEQREGIIGTPVVEANSRYLLPVSYGDRIEVTTWIEEWREKSVVVRHAIARAGQAIAEGREARVFATRHPADPTRIRSVPPPQYIRVLCS